MKRHNKKWYSILAALFIVWFLLVLASWVFHLVLNELNANRARSNYIKAYYGAESGIEWALLNIKNVGYGLSDTIEGNINPRSVVLGAFPWDMTKFKRQKEILLSYDIDTKVQSFSGKIVSGGHEIIPIFYLDIDGTQHDAKELNLSIVWFPDAIAWNIVWEQYGLSGVGNFSNTTQWDYKFIENGSLQLEKRGVWAYLDSSTSNYLILFNAHPTQEISYEVTTSAPNWITKPVGTIYASGYIGSYKQNIKVSLDNTAYLSILKYSIFSN